MVPWSEINGRWFVKRDGGRPQGTFAEMEKKIRHCNKNHWGFLNKYIFFYPREHWCWKNTAWWITLHGQLNQKLKQSCIWRGEQPIKALLSVFGYENDFKCFHMTGKCVSVTASFENGSYRRSFLPIAAVFKDKSCITLMLLTNSNWLSFWLEGAAVMDQPSFVPELKCCTKIIDTR